MVPQSLPLKWEHENQTLANPFYKSYVYDSDVFCSLQVLYYEPDMELLLYALVKTVCFSFANENLVFTAENHMISVLSILQQSPGKLPIVRSIFFTCKLS